MTNACFQSYHEHYTNQIWFNIVYMRNIQWSNFKVQHWSMPSIWILYQIKYMYHSCQKVAVDILHFFCKFIYDKSWHKCNFKRVPSQACAKNRARYTIYMKWIFKNLQGQLDHQKKCSKLEFWVLDLLR